ncbi:hypothetical protein HAX54_025708 [Datura stramonium]|uniref:Uncharacterized protein n=1 Tax=Datura stramonium TaxID=4076 RepID=A0ABS8UZX0_DATST|nr:hypothetical protein [Datura stramonium]
MLSRSNKLVTADLLTGLSLPLQRSLDRYNGLAAVEQTRCSRRHCGGSNGYFPSLSQRNSDCYYGLAAGGIPPQYLDRPMMPFEFPDMVIGLPKIKVQNDKVCSACVRGSKPMKDESETDEHAQEQVASPVSTIEQSVDSLTGETLNMEATIEIDTPIAATTKMDRDEIGSSMELRSRLCFHEIDI